MWSPPPASSPFSISISTPGGPAHGWPGRQQSGASSQPRTRPCLSRRRLDAGLAPFGRFRIGKPRRKVRRGSICLGSAIPAVRSRPGTGEARKLMRLIEQLEAAHAAEQSVFRAQLIKEDIARLRTLAELAAKASSPEDFVRQGLLIGWTLGDARTFELRPALVPLLMAFHAAGLGGEEAEARLASAWQAFDSFRMERL